MSLYIWYVLLNSILVLRSSVPLDVIHQLGWSSCWRYLLEDAVPKKRGPKTDVLEALLKRVDGLERRLQEEGSTVSPTSENPPSTTKRKIKGSSAGRSNSADETGSSIQSSLSIAEQEDPNQMSFADRRGSMLLTSTYNGFSDHPINSFRHGQQTNTTNRQDNAFLSDTILDTYFTRLHGKPFYILEESSTRQRHHMGQLPGPLMMAIYAITIRYIPHVCH